MARNVNMLIWRPATERETLESVARKYWIAQYNTCGALRDFYSAILAQVETTLSRLDATA